MDTIIDPRSLLSTRDLIAVGMQGDEVRRRMHGARTTFVRVLEIHVEAPTTAAPPGLRAGEFRIVGSPQSEEAAVTAVMSVAALAQGHDGAGPPQASPANAKAEAGHYSASPVTGFSLADLLALAPTPGSFKALCSRLRAAGLEAIAETPLDLLDDAVTAVRAAREAGLEVWRLTVHSLPNDQVDQRVATVRRAKDLQGAVGGFRAFAPLPRTISVSAPTTGYDDVKQVALARLVVTNIDSIQVDWPLYGPKLAQVALTMGADDVDGISAVDPGVLGTRRSPIEEIKGNIRAAALEPAERDGRFQLMT